MPNPTLISAVLAFINANNANERQYIVDERRDLLFGDLSNKLSKGDIANAI